MIEIVRARLSASAVRGGSDPATTAFPIARAGGRPQARAQAARHDAVSHGTTLLAAEHGARTAPSTRSGEGRRRARAKRGATDGWGNTNRTEGSNPSLSAILPAPRGSVASGGLGRNARRFAAHFHERIPPSPLFLPQLAEPTAHAGATTAARRRAIARSVPVCSLMQPPEGRFRQGHAATRFATACGHQREGVIRFLQGHAARVGTFSAG